jgi:hypothetical protein
MRTIIALAALAMLASSAQAKIVKVPCFVSQGNWTNAPDKSCQIWDGGGHEKRKKGHSRPRST